MGAYLYYQLKNRREEDIVEVNDFLKSQDENKILKLLENSPCQVYFMDQDSVDWHREHGCSKAEALLGRGNIKTSGIDGSIDELGLYLELQTKIFEKLNERYEVQYKARSCSFAEEEYYFTIEQMKRITHNGRLLSQKGDEKHIMLKKLLRGKE